MKRIIEKILVKLFPASFYRLVGGLWGYLVRTKKSYSQYGEDLILESFFSRYGIKSGVYVDIGAFHPRWLSNTHRLFLSGWKGSAVDIDEHKIKLFKMMRENCDGFVGAVAPGPNKSKLNVYRFQKLWSEIDTLSLEDATKYEKMFAVKYDSSEIETLNINYILEKTQIRYGHINFINIDVEGLDEAILFDVDFTKCSPDVICFENNIYYGGSDKLQEYLKVSGYLHLFTAGGTHAYCRSSIVTHK